MSEKAPRAPYKRDEDGKWYYGLAVGPFDTRGEARSARASLMATSTGDGPEGLKNALTVAPVKTTKKKAVAKKKATTKPKVVTKKKAKPAGRKGEGIVDAIRTGFQAGNTTVAEVETYLRKVKVQASPNTVKTQVGRLRKAAGLTKVRKEKGIVATIRKGYAKGNDTVAKMARFLDKAGVEASPNTIKTQVGRLRRADGLTGRAA